MIRSNSFSVTVFVNSPENYRESSGSIASAGSQPCVFTGSTDLRSLQQQEILSNQFSEQSKRLKVQEALQKGILCIIKSFLTAIKDGLMWNS